MIVTPVMIAAGMRILGGIRIITIAAPSNNARNFGEILAQAASRLRLGIASHNAPKTKPILASPP